MKKYKVFETRKEGYLLDPNIGKFFKNELTGEKLLVVYTTNNIEDRFTESNVVLSSELPDNISDIYGSNDKLEVVTSINLSNIDQWEIELTDETYEMINWFKSIGCKDEEVLVYCDKIRVSEKTTNKIKVFETRDLPSPIVDWLGLTEQFHGVFHIVKNLQDSQWFIDQGCQLEETVLIVHIEPYPTYAIKDLIKYQEQTLILASQIPDEILETFGRKEKGFVTYFDVNERSGSRLWFQGELLKEGKYYEMAKWFLDYGCQNETVIVYH